MAQAVETKFTIGKKKNIDKNVWDLALGRIRHVYDMFDTVSVSFSGGKDSTAVLNLCLQVAKERNRLPLHVIHFDEEAIPYEVEDYLRRMIASLEIKLDWYCVPIKHRNACSAEHPYWYTWAPEDEDIWVRPMPPEAIREVPGYDTTDPKDRLTIPEISGMLFDPVKHGRVAMLLGIRADESMSRYRSVARREDDNYIVKHNSGFSGGHTQTFGNVWKVYPIYDWTTPDVWTAPSLHGWDYCEYYDILEMSGVSHHAQRLAPPFGEEPFKSLWTFSVGFPDLWAKMCKRVPGAATAARYSDTELYAFGSLPTKPPGTTWEDFIKEYIQKHDRSVRTSLAKRISSEINRHYKKTNDPILDKSPHPLSGISWQYLLMLAIRGDVKNRKQPPVVVPNSPARTRAEEKYKIELAGLSEEGTRY